MQDWSSLTQAQLLGQSFAIKNILLVNRVEMEAMNDTARALKFCLTQLIVINGDRSTNLKTTYTLVYYFVSF